MKKKKRKHKNKNSIGFKCLKIFICCKFNYVINVLYLLLLVVIIFVFNDIHVQKIPGNFYYFCFKEVSKFYLFIEI